MSSFLNGLEPGWLRLRLSATWHLAAGRLAAQVLGASPTDQVADSGASQVPSATITGTVVERLDGPPYSFLRSETEEGMTWVAVPMADVPSESELQLLSYC